MTETSIDNRPYITSSGRDLRLDFLRGYFIMIMIIDHIIGPSPLYWFTGGTRFFISGAEGFFLISGLVTGIVYHRIIESKGLKATLQKMIRRLFVLYLVATSLKLVPLIFKDTLWTNNQAQPLQITRVFTLQAGGVITAYVFLFILAPFALTLLNRGKGYILLAISWLWYILYVFFPATVTFPFATFTNLSGLQVLFFTAMFVGFKEHKTLDYGKIIINKNWLFCFASCFLVLIILFILLNPPPMMQQDLIPQATKLWINAHLFDKATLRPGRLIAAIPVYGTFFVFLSLYWKKVVEAFGWIILPFGTSALYAYSVHIPIDYAINLLIASGVLSSTFISNMFIQTTAVLLIWFLTSWRVLAPTRETMKFWYLFPFVLGLLLLGIDFIHPQLLFTYFLRAIVYWITWFPASPVGL
ncbi:MAG: OpgC domain-containing protein [Bacillota bacterium]